MTTDIWVNETLYAGWGQRFRVLRGDRDITPDEGLTPDRYPGR